MELQSTITIDFSGASALSQNMRAAADSTARMRRDLTLSRSDAVQLWQSQRNFQASQAGGIGSAQGRTLGSTANVGDRLALAGATAAGTALSWRAASLANPAAVQRFQDAIDDTTAVIGHRLIPALNELTRIIRGLGDWLARNPEVATAAGYAGVGAVGLTGAAALYGFGRMAVGGAVSAYQSARSGVNWLRGVPSAEAAAATAAANQSSAARIAELNLRAQSASFRAASGEIGAAAEAAAINAELASAGTATAGSTASKFGRAGRLIGRAALPVAIGLEAYQAKQDMESGRFAAGVMERSGPAFGPTGAFFQPREQLWGIQAAGWVARNTGMVSRREWDYALEGLYADDSWYNPFYDPEQAAQLGRKRGYNPKGMLGGSVGGESFGAAARPAQYEDVIGSLLGMRQQIASMAGNDPADRTAEASEGILGFLVDRFGSDEQKESFNKPSERSTANGE